MKELTNQDLATISKIGIEKETIYTQFEKLIQGPKTLDLKGACVIGNGIQSIPVSQHKQLVDYYCRNTKDKTVSMFTPASGAATRMFKHLINPEADKALYSKFLDGLERFAFHAELAGVNSESKDEITKYILSPEGLNYANLPKAMISFHEYNGAIHKAIDDQLEEGVKYLAHDNQCDFHFTVSPEHKEIVSNHLGSVIQVLEKKHNLKINVSFSFQEKSTNTIALDANNNLVRNKQNELLLRPGGHGALIHNLNDINTDIVFLKNIDNIARRDYHDNVAKYKMIIGAKLLELQKEVFSILEEITDNVVSDNRLIEITNWIKAVLGIHVDSSSEQIIAALNKPIRVCGMVKNEGKAGGGPFWVGNSVQIVESAQMDLENPEVKSMLEKASHFNPVDIVCGMKDHRGEKFNLLDFTDEAAFFVSDKSYLGKDIKVLEHPGLWNGAMANWLTLFVEVPVSTFNPVKTVNDLLLPQHCVK